MFDMINIGSVAIDDLLKAIGLVGAGIGWVYQVRAKWQRDKIKTDLEILEKSKLLFGAEDERTKRIEAKVTHLMGYLYRHTKAQPERRFNLGDLVLAAACTVGSFAFAWSGITTEATYRYLEFFVAGLVAFIGIGAWVNAFSREDPLGAEK
jgi:hypothetical protein